MSRQPLDNPRRRTIARACADRPRGLAEISRATGIENGPLSGLLQRMVADQVLEADGEPGRRGTMYVLSADMLPELDAPVSGHDPGRLEQGQRMIAVRGGTLMAITRMIAQAGLTAELIWSVRLAGDTDWLLAFDPTVTSLAVDRLTAAFESVGATCTKCVVDLIMRRGELERYCRAIMDGAETGVLVTQTPHNSTLT